MQELPNGFKIEVITVSDNYIAAHVIDDRLYRNPIEKLEASSWEEMYGMSLSSIAMRLLEIPTPQESFAISGWVTGVGPTITGVFQ